MAPFAAASAAAAAAVAVAGRTTTTASAARGIAVVAATSAHHDAASHARVSPLVTTRQTKPDKLGRRSAASSSTSSSSVSSSPAQWPSAAAAASAPAPAHATLPYSPLSGTSAHYLDQLYAAWVADPSFVPADVAGFLASISSSSSSSPTATTVAGSAFDSRRVADHLKAQLLVRAYQVRGHRLAYLDPLGISRDAAVGPPPPEIPELDPAYYGFTPADLANLRFELGPAILPGFRLDKSTDAPVLMPLGDIVARLRDVYCSTIGVEYMHIVDRRQCDWLRARFEVPDRLASVCRSDVRRKSFDRLVWSDSFERFVATKFPSEKRFGLEGCEALVPGMKALVDRAVENGVEYIVMGMPHRGRLNVLFNVVRKPAQHIFSEFAGVNPLSSTAENASYYAPAQLFSGDVKYHLGMNYDRPTPSGKRVHLSLVANPSHLEAVNPVVLGKTRALQLYLNDESRGRALPVLLHGDAAFAGQGVVYETLGFSDLPSYSVGGTIHIIVNNQVGFTTDPRFSRSTPYCSDVAKTVGAPIIHVNADDVDAVVYACHMAADWRQTFKRDVVIDLVCYRRHGHNEVDQPAFTQPRMYQHISKKPRVLELYSQSLLASNTMTKQEIEETKESVWKYLEAAYVESKSSPMSEPAQWVSESWHGLPSFRSLASTAVLPRATGVSVPILREIAAGSASCPSTFTLHPQLARILAARRKLAEECNDDDATAIDWATAEAVAFGSLLVVDKAHVRLSGQDVERGTFSHRHAVLHDQKTEEQYVPLNNLKINNISSSFDDSVSKNTRENEHANGEKKEHSGDEMSSLPSLISKIPPPPAQFTVCNSSLSEFGVLGFELGYSLVHPKSLVIWEAQFGDFANNAQCIIDQFIASGEQKWMQRTGLVVNLPHGYDGQGPEHSSSRLERFLQLIDGPTYGYPSEQALSRQHQDCNMQIAYPSTPANYFHLLRRQLAREFRKPLILAFSKALLRHPMARSALADMGPGTVFQRVIPETIKEQNPENVTRVILCTGQVYYTLVRARKANGLDDSVAIVRVEQLAPFPYDLVAQELSKYKSARVVWAQEEPMNMGAWTYIQPRLQSVVKHINQSEKSAMPVLASDHPTSSRTVHGQPLDSDVVYAGRQATGAVATGNKYQHIHEERSLVSDALFGHVLELKKEENGVPVFNSIAN